MLYVQVDVGGLACCRTGIVLLEIVSVAVRSALVELISSHVERLGYTIGMKTAVSLPDRVFREAERHARRTRKSRSQLYAEALAEYLAHHAPDAVTEDMNTTMDQLGTSAPDEFVARAARHVLERTEW
jgi:hypothetical protein